MSLVIGHFTGCKEFQISNDPSLCLAVSRDTLHFDTVFTEQGSATMQMKLYNRNANALLIDRVWMDEGKAFKVNIDGEPKLSQISDLQIDGGDSLYVFVRVYIDPTDVNNPVLVTDNLHFHTSNGATKTVNLEAYGQDVERIGKPGCKRTDKLRGMTFTADKPYLIFDTLDIQGTTTMEAGAKIYMHQGACIIAHGKVESQGTPENHVVLCGDRLDRLFEHVPYRFASGGWDGLYIADATKDMPRVPLPRTYTFSYTDILSGNVGLMCVSDRTNASLSTLTMNGCRIHNHTAYGLYLYHVNAVVTNTEISNCALYCIYSEGGKHDFIHSTVASYFGYTNIRIQSTAKEATSAVYIDNLSKKQPETVVSFYNSIITGYLANQLVVATPIDRYYPGTFQGNYLKTDSLLFEHATDNVYWHATDTAEVFVNDFYKYKEYVYYDFHPDTLGPAIGIGQEISTVKSITGFDELPIEQDYDGIDRLNVHPDAGCYQHLP